MRVASNIVVPDVVIPSAALTWLVRLVNEYAQPAREAAGEESDPSRRDGRPRRHAHLADDATRPDLHGAAPTAAVRNHQRGRTHGPVQRHPAGRRLVAEGEEALRAALEDQTHGLRGTTAGRVRGSQR